jgi:hypothetical protein
MQMSRDRILTTHAGSLPRPDALIAAKSPVSKPRSQPAGSNKVL